MGDGTTHWGKFERIPPQGGLNTDKMDNAEGDRWEVEVYPAERSDGGGGVIGGGDLSLPLPEHSCAVHCNQANCVTGSGGR